MTPVSKLDGAEHQMPNLPLMVPLQGLAIMLRRYDCVWGLLELILVLLQPLPEAIGCVRVFGFFVIVADAWGALRVLWAGDHGADVWLCLRASRTYPASAATIARSDRFLVPRVRVLRNCCSVCGCVGY